MGSDKAIVKAKTDSIVRDSFLEVITGVNIDKVVAAKKRKAAAKAATKAATKAASQYGALAQAAFPPPWASPPPHLHQNAWPMYPPDLYPYQVPYPVPVPVLPPPPPPPPQPPHSIGIAQTNTTNSAPPAPPKPSVIPVSNPAQPELPATLPSQITFVACHHCSICGRPRSQGYHRDHPLVPDQIAVSEPCGKCVRASRDQPVAYIVKAIETGSDRRKARLQPQQRTRMTVVSRERHRSRSRSRGPSRRALNRPTHREDGIEYRHVPEQRGVEGRERSTRRFEEKYPIYSAPAPEEHWKYRYEPRTASVPFYEDRELPQPRKETRSHCRMTEEIMPRPQPSHEERPPAPMPEERVTYRRRQSESLSTHPESFRERYIEVPHEFKEVRRMTKIYRDSFACHPPLRKGGYSPTLTSTLTEPFAGSSATRGRRRHWSRAPCIFRSKTSENGGRWDEKESSAAVGSDRELTSHRRASESDGSREEEKKRSITIHVRHAPSHCTSSDIDELDNKKSRIFIRYVSPRRKTSDLEKRCEREEKKAVADQSGSISSRHEGSGEQQHDEEKEAEQDERSVIGGFRYVAPGYGRHGNPQYYEKAMHVEGEILGSFRYGDAHGIPKEPVAAENLFSPDSQALIRRAKNYEIRHNTPQDTKSQDRDVENEKPKEHLEGGPPLRGQSKVRFVSLVLGSPSRKTFRSNDRVRVPPSYPQSGDAPYEHDEEDPETQVWNEAFRNERIRPPTSDPRKGKFPVRDSEEEAKNQIGEDEWASNRLRDLLLIRRTTSPQAEGRGQFRTGSRSRARSEYEAYHTYHTQPPTPPPVLSPPLFPQYWPHSSPSDNAWYQNPNPGETKAFGERSAVGEGQKETWWKGSASDSTRSNGETEPKAYIDGVDEEGWVRAADGSEDLESKRLVSFQERRGRNGKGSEGKRAGESFRSLTFEKLAHEDWWLEPLVEEKSLAEEGS